MIGSWNKGPVCPGEITSARISGVVTGDGKRIDSLGLKQPDHKASTMNTNEKQLLNLASKPNWAPIEGTVWRLYTVKLFSNSITRGGIMLVKVKSTSYLTLS